MGIKYSTVNREKVIEELNKYPDNFDITPVIFELLRDGYYTENYMTEFMNLVAEQKRFKITESMSKRVYYKYMKGLIGREDNFVHMFATKTECRLWFRHLAIIIVKEEEYNNFLPDFVNWGQ